MLFCLCTDGKTIRTEAIIGIVAATVIIIALLALGVAVCRSRKKFQAFASGSEFLMFSFLSLGDCLLDTFKYFLQFGFVCA